MAKKVLVKVATELNVGKDSIVDHLLKKGFEIDNKPNAKITEEMYSELVKEFQKDMAIKGKADSLVIGTRPAQVKEPTKEKPAITFSREDVSKPKPFSLRGKKEEPTPPPAPKAEPTPEPAPTPTPEPVVEVPKVEVPVAKKPTPEPAPPIEAPAKPATKSPDKPIAKSTAKKRPEMIERPQSGGLKVIGKIDLEAKKKADKKKAKPTPKKKEQKAEVPKPAPAKKTEPKVEKPAEKAPPVEQPAPQEQKKKTAEPLEMKRAKTPELRGLKILGKVDASTLKEPKRPKKKKDGQGKTDNKNQPAKGSEGEKQRRRRTTRRKVTPNSRTGNAGGNRQGGGNNTRPAGNRPSGGRPSAGNRPGNRAGGQGQGRGRRDEVKEVSKKEIEAKIKATMARMQGGGKRKRQKLRRETRERLREKQEMREMEQVSDKLQVTEFISVTELASLMNVSAADVITACFSLGVIVSINQRLDAEIIELVATEFEHEIEFISAEEEEDVEVDDFDDDEEDLVPRAPIVTVMGHVDHGKTSLLDYIRKANVADGEAGGITQHIGAYEVVVKGKKITFLDTPGHEAFTAMRARGAKVTDIAIVIVAADDGIMPQTREAISHAAAAGVPIIFAINKIDKDGANPEKIKGELAALNYQVEDWGGKYQSQDISAKAGTNIEELLEKVLLEAEMLELKANPDRAAIGTVIEASLEKGRGYSTKILVQNGTLEIGESVAAGEYSGKIKAMFNERGKKLKTAGPSTPVLILGLDGAPQAGERLKVYDSDQEARQIASRRGQINREQANRATKRISLDEIGRRLALGTFKELNLIVKGDVDGSIEALSDSLLKLSQETVQVNVIHKAVGGIIESDVLLASASDAIIIGFQVRPSVGSRQLAEREGVQIKTYSIIYEAIEEIKAAIEGMLEPTKEEKITATVEVRDIFKISKIGTIAGCYVQDGKIQKNSHIRIIRDGIVIYPTKEGQKGEISGLKRVKDEVKEVRSGTECGISVKNFNDIKIGDIIEGYEIIEIKQTLA